ncbi:conserved hypothetical protein [Arthrobacter sp. FB24]|uniref:hypothetical protein n=1 Tax=Arthrobacter sp. (strain FB24) TaxID=290399 RepID=UPI0000E5D57F|nr:hypothetical protein [Arthrobacter sp. FB24]ABK02371.1 conserved hypothetical protein [Arthrobacter sp. FB24]
MNAFVPSEKVNSLLSMLEHFRWFRAEGAPGRFDVWREAEGPGEIVVPLDEERPDFARLLARAEQEIVLRFGSEARHAQELWRLKEAVELDESHWQKETTLDAGLIRWNDGELLYASARSMLTASAKSTREARMYHGNASAFIAKQFIDECYMGQTAIGSYIITAHTQAKKRFYLTKRSEEVAAQRPPLAEAVSGREILNTFERSLDVARRCLDEYRSRPVTDMFVEAVDEGLSYEFVKALGDVTRDSASGIQVLRYSSGGTRPLKREFEFVPAEARVLDRVATRFAQAPQSEQVTLTGEVVLLSHASATDVRVIRLVVESGSAAKKARVRLTADQYRVALQAHASDSMLQVSGRLEREGNFYWLYDAADVSVVPNDNAERVDYEHGTLF